MRHAQLCHMPCPVPKDLSKDWHGRHCPRVVLYRNSQETHTQVLPADKAKSFFVGDAADAATDFADSDRSVSPAEYLPSFCRCTAMSLRAA